MRRFAPPLVLVLGGILACPCAAAPILIDFEGTIEVIDDAGGWAAEFGLFLGGTVDAVYQLDPDAGLVEFGDGRHGARLPSGGRVMAGTYRAGGGKEGNLLIFDDCWVGDFACVTGEGGDAYFVDLAGGSDSGVDYKLLIGLSTLDGSVLGGDREITPLPPDPRRFEDASFRWLLTDGVRTTEITGGVVSLHPVAEPSTFMIALLGFGLVARHRNRSV